MKRIEKVPPFTKLDKVKTKQKYPVKATIYRSSDGIYFEKTYSFISNLPAPLRGLDKVKISCL